MNEQILSKLLKEAVDFHLQGNLDQAEQIYKKIIDADSVCFDAIHSLGVLELQRRNFSSALNLISRAIQINPNNEMAHSNLGILLNYLNRHEEALASHNRAIEIQPNYAEAYSSRGIVLNKLGRFEEAIESYNSAISLRPNFFEAYSNRGNALLELSHYEEAVKSYNLAIEIRPNLTEAYSSRGNALKELNRFEEAVESYNFAISLQPNLSKVHYNLAIVLVELGRFKNAIESYDRAIAIQPEDAGFKLNKSIALLTIGEYARGWPLYEWRWKLKNVVKLTRHSNHPLWLGKENLNGKTILLHAEQGLGDTIQFCRYAKIIKAMGATVLLEVNKALNNLLEQLEGVDLLIEAGKPLPIFDFQCPLMSLPMACETALNNIPNPTAYLKADEEKIGFWQKRINHIKGLKVGVVWNGGFRENRPDIWGLNERRNISLQIFSSELNSLDISFFSLQKGDPAETEIRNRETEFWPLGNFYNFASDLKDFSDTAALISTLDVVVSVDTSTAHLSAALGKPTWILNRHNGCWRWLLDRDDSPWYSSVKLYRQSTDADWRPVLKRVAKDLLSTQVK